MTKSKTFEAKSNVFEAKSNVFEQSASKVADIVDQVPLGKCTTYGGIGKAIGITPRYVARIMATAEEIHATPWHRVVGAGGTIRAGAHRNEQLRRLRSEGFEFNGNSIVDFKSHLHEP
jgi:methylated-DNA-protein-cysteine methyltransferase related protein